MRFFSVGLDDAYHTGSVQLRPGVDEVFAVRADPAGMPAGLLGQTLGLSALYVGAEQMPVCRRYLKRVVIDILALDFQQLYVSIGIDYTLGLSTLHTAKIEVPVSVTHVGLVDEMLRVIGQECERIERFHIPVIVVGEEGAYVLAV